MRWILGVAFVAVALAGCGGDEIEFDIDSPPQWLKNLDAKLPAKPLQANELLGGCVGQAFRGRCDASVRPSKAMARKANFRLMGPQEVKITYTPNEKANDVNVTLRMDRKATIPIRKGGGTITFRCVKAFDPCVIQLEGGGDA